MIVFASSPDTTRRRLWIATNSSGGGFAAAYGTAAWLHGIDGFDTGLPLEVLGDRGRRVHNIDGLVQHYGRLERADRTMIDGIRCTGLARTICDVASAVGRRRTLRAIDDFERRGFSLRWLSETAERLHRPGQAGTGLVKRLLATRSGRAPDTWFERLTEECLQLADLPPWTRQHRVFDEQGAFVGRIDLACVPLRLGVEAHSKQFHFGAGPGTDDQRRDDRMASIGWLLRYVGWHAVTQTPASGCDDDRPGRPSASHRPRCAPAMDRCDAVTEDVPRVEADACHQPRQLRRETSVL